MTQVSLMLRPTSQPRVAADMGLYLRVGLVVVVALVVQVELFSDTRIFGVMPELLLGTTIAAGWAAGPERGALVGFGAGILYDLYLPTPLGLTAIAYVLTGFGVGVVAVTVAVSGERIVRRLISFAAVATGMTLFVLIGVLLGQSNLYSDRFFFVVFVASLYTAIFTPLLHRAMQWAFGVHSDDARSPVRLSVLE